MELAEWVAIGLLVGMSVIVTVAFGLGFASIASVTASIGRRKNDDRT